MSGVVMATTVILLWLLYVFFMSIVNISDIQIEPSSDFIRRKQNQVGKHFNYIDSLTLHDDRGDEFIENKRKKIQLIFLTVKTPSNRGIRRYQRIQL